MILSILVRFWGVVVMITVDVDALGVWFTRNWDEADLEDEGEVIRGEGIFGLAMEDGK